MKNNPKIDSPKIDTPKIDILKMDTQEMDVLNIDCLKIYGLKTRGLKAHSRGRSWCSTTSFHAMSSQFVSILYDVFAGRRGFGGKSTVQDGSGKYVRSWRIRLCHISAKHSAVIYLKLVSKQLMIHKTTANRFVSYVSLVLVNQFEENTKDSLFTRGSFFTQNSFSMQDSLLP